MASFDLLDSGERAQYDTGAQRDTAEGKGRFDLISAEALARLSRVMELGAKKYNDRNWEKGIPLARCLDSALRHINQWQRGLRDEDHLSQAVFNLFAIIHLGDLIDYGSLPRHLLEGLPNRAILTHFPDRAAVESS